MKDTHTAEWDFAPIGDIVHFPHGLEDAIRKNADRLAPKRLDELCDVIESFSFDDLESYREKGLFTRVLLERVRTHAEGKRSGGFWDTLKALEKEGVGEVVDTEEEVPLPEMLEGQKDILSYITDLPDAIIAYTVKNVSSDIFEGTGLSDVMLKEFLEYMARTNKEVLLQLIRNLESKISFKDGNRLLTIVMHIFHHAERLAEQVIESRMGHDLYSKDDLPDQDNLYPKFKAIRQIRNF